MVVTAELIVTVVTVFGAAATILGGVAGMLAWAWRRVDQRFARVEAQMAELVRDVGDVRVAIARIEGPVSRLMIARR